MIDTHCPGCQVDIRPDDGDPEDGSMLICNNCGYVGMWDVETEHWRAPSADERADLMRNESYLTAMSYGLVFRSWRDRDKTKLVGLISKVVPYLDPDLKEKLTAEIIAAKYHTHPTRAELEALDALEFEDEL